MTDRGTTTELPRETRAGVGTDVDGGSVVDPTKNVRELVEAANRRQDDLRLAEQAHIREVLALRAELGQQDSDCSNEVASLRALHAQDLRLAEAARINAIREVDVKAVQQAAEVQSTAADRLAKQVVEAAEAMRTQVAAVATATATALAAALAPINEAIADLRKAQYEAQGQKTQVVETQAKSGNTGLWIGAGIAGFVMFLLLIGTIIALVSALSGPSS